MALRWAAALALLGACGAAQVHYEIMPPVEYHVALETAGDRPVIVAFLDETLKEHKEELGVFNAAAAEFGCLTTVRTKDDVFKHVNEGGTFVMRAGVDSIARSIVDDTKVRRRRDPRPHLRAWLTARLPARAQLELPAAVIFRKAGAPAEYYDGEEWDAASLRNWAYKAVTGAAIVATADELRDGALAELQAVGFVGELCGPEAVEFTTALMKHARLGRPLPSLITTNHKLGEYAGVHDCLGVNGTVLDAGYGVAVLGRCAAAGYPARARPHTHTHRATRPRSHGDGAASVFPTERLEYTTAELEPWLAGLLGKLAAAAQPPEPPKEPPTRRPRRKQVEEADEDGDEEEASSASTALSPQAAARKKAARAHADAKKRRSRMEPPRDAPLSAESIKPFSADAYGEKPEPPAPDDLDGDAPPPDDEGLGAILDELARDEEAAFKARDEL